VPPEEPRVFRSVLVANRGEIALRVLRACRTLGIRGVAVYSEADRDAPWLEHADRTVCIGPARAESSYRNADAILQAAEQCEVQAIHPGYGFLSENATFAARCEQQGITFIGPRPAAIRRMGDKVEARRTMERAGLPVLAGSRDRLRTAADACRAAEAIGYPVLLKAAAGGGGRGMRRADDAVELERAFDEASGEARSAFGDGGLYLERLVAPARHVEFQVLADAFGAVVHLGERECSVQRKHQKLIEETPSPALDGRTRAALGRRVTRAVAAVGYRGAGTVEFLLDATGELSFLEMNTRLQVEHPVTEAVTGIDLVAEQIRIAANRKLTLAQRDVESTGHAIEFRINAEDPDHDFRPDPGTITAFAEARTSVTGARLRWDSAIRPGYRVPPHYDSLLGKLVVHAADRPAALAAADEALATLSIGGVHTTIPFHRRVLGSREFRAGAYDTSIVERLESVPRAAERRS
jgi:acetyl-CoA carboxylase, biotin carboxylase subunit